MWPREPLISKSLSFAQSFQIYKQFSGGLIAVSRILRQALFDNPAKFLRDPRIYFGSWQSATTEDGGDELRALNLRERRLPGGHLVQYATCSMDVAARIDVFAQQQFRRHVGQSPCNSVC